MESVGAGPVSVCCAEFRCGIGVGGACVLDLFSRKLLASPTAEHPDAELAGDAIKMAAAVRGGRTVIDGVIFHTDYAEVCVKPRVCGDGLRLWGLLADFSA